MDDTSGKNGDSELIAGIREAAREEIARIEKDAAETAAQRREAARTQVESILKEAEKRAVEQARQITKNAKAALSVEVHRIELRARDEFFSAVLAEAERRLAALAATPGYSKVLEGWITEAAIGLDEERALVNASAAERPLLQSVLPAAEQRIYELTGRHVALVPSPDPPVTGQGVVLTSGSGRTAFNNQIRTRMLRFQSAIRKAIYDELAAETAGRKDG